MAPKALTRTTLAALVLGLAACGVKKEATPEAGVDLAAIRARRDSLRKVAQQDSLARVRFTTCSDSVVAELAKALKKSKKKQAPTPTGMIPPEVLSVCGKPPAPKPTQVAQAPKSASDSAAHLVPAKPDTTHQAMAKPDTGHAATAKATAKVDSTKLAKGKADTAKAHAPVVAVVPAPPAGKADTGKAAAKPAQPAAPAQVPAPPPAKPLTAKQLQVLRADSIRQAKERAKQDSLRQVAERAHQDSIVKAQRDSVRAESLKVARETEVLRETFTYAGGSRDPFASLITEDKVGPEFNDLLLVGVYLDLRRSNNSVAILRDKTNQKRYKLRVGDHLGRLKVAQIRQLDVVFTVEDIGFERQETLSLRKKEDQTP